MVVLSAVRPHISAVSLFSEINCPYPQALTPADKYDCLDAQTDILIRSKPSLRIPADRQTEIKYPQVFKWTGYPQAKLRLG